MGDSILAKRKRNQSKLYNLYVVDLKKNVLEDRKFKEENPHYNPAQNKPCVYVGYTAKTPEQRFQQHIEGKKCNKYARDFGFRLRPRNYEKYNPISGDRNYAQKKERELAEKLRQKGYAV